MDGERAIEEQPEQIREEIHRRVERLRGEAKALKRFLEWTESKNRTRRELDEEFA
jgi:hypothetical protein